MLEKTIDRIAQMALEAAETEIVKVEGDPRKFSDASLVPIRPATPHPLEIGTLDGIIDWIETEGAGADLLIHVEGPGCVSVKSVLDDAYLQRGHFLTAAAPRCGFNFGDSMSIERFIINVQLNFEDSPEKAALLKHVSSIAKNEIHVAEDDGVTQTTIHKDEIGRLEADSISPIQKLRPFRTFREVEQPLGEFLLRILNSRGELPQIVLYEASGIAWKLDAVGSIHAYLRKALPEAVIIR